MNETSNKMTCTPGKRLPKSVQTYMIDFEETESEVKRWLHVQKDAFAGIKEPATDLPGWVAFKMAGSRAGAVSALRWAGIKCN